MMTELYSLRPGAQEVLAENPDLQRLVIETIHHLRRIFGPADIVLERFDCGLSPILFVLARTELSAEAAFERLNSFRERWWLDNLWRADMKLEVTVEFI
jgi:hypothetical protein